MSLAQVPSLDRRPSNGNPLSLSSNNPFRRGISPSAPSANVPPQNMTNGERQQPSRNPFLNDPLPPQFAMPAPLQRQISPPKPMLPSARYNDGPRQMPQREPPVDLLQGLSLNEKSALDRSMPPRGQNFPPRNQSYVRHRPTHSQEESRRARMESQGTSEVPVNIFATPPKNNETRRSRRNSDTSVIEARDEERRHRDREQRRKDRDARHRGLKLGKPKKPHPQMDVIDKLDVSNIYGAGLFHHDGPFDACNPHRNRKGMKDAPMQAFPAGSANNALGGRGPLNKTVDIEKFHGRGAEGFSDFNDTTAAPPPEIPVAPKRPERMHTNERPYVPERVPPQDRSEAPERPGGPQRAYTEKSYRNDRQYAPERPAIIDPKQRTDHIHGEESAGLGTTTFLEGAPAPASRIAIQQRESEAESSAPAAPTLQRKKSLAQKLRGISRSGVGDAGRVTSPEARYASADTGEHPLLPSGGPLSAGGRGKPQEVNPFFEPKDANVRVADVSFEPANPREHTFPRTLRSRTLSSPQRPLFRMKTNDSSNGAEADSRSGGFGSGGGGLLSRVKSIRTGKR